MRAVQSSPAVVTMPDRAGHRTMHQLCDSVSGANWRPTRFEDELTLSRYACCVCHVVPSTTIVLPCSHALCEHCLTGCVVRDGGSVCPVDAEPFCEDECQRSQLPARKKQNLKAHCWNEDDGCEFVGTIEAVLLHFDRECAFHALQCPRCEGGILRTGISAHYVAGCTQNASCASGAQPNRQDGSSSSCDTSVILNKFSTLQRQMNEVSARAQDISRVVSGFENSLQRGMESIEANICTMVTRQLNAGQKELRASNGDQGSDHLSSLQSQMNELVEQSRQRDVSQMQEIGRALRDSHIEVKEDVKVQLKELVDVLRDSGCELEEHVSRVEANLSSRLNGQQRSLQEALDSLKQNEEASEREGPLAVATSEKEDEFSLRFKLDVLANETLTTQEFLRQEAYRHDKKPWFSNTDAFRDDCAMWSNDFEPLGFDVTLNDCENIDRLVNTVTNRYYRDMRMQITFTDFDTSAGCFLVSVDCVKTLGNSSFPFTEVTVNAVRSNPQGLVPFLSCGQTRCFICFRKRISHFQAAFGTRKKLDEYGVIKDGKLKLRFEFE